MMTFMEPFIDSESGINARGISEKMFEKLKS